MHVTAEVRRGGGAARGSMIRRPIRVFGFRPHPGTLNAHLTAPIVVGSEPVGWVDWFGGEYPWYRGAVDGRRCVVLGVEPEMSAGHKLELIAEVHLRSVLDVETGDLVTIELEAS